MIEACTKVSHDKHKYYTKKKKTLLEHRQIPTHEKGVLE